MAVRKPQSSAYVRDWIRNRRVQLVEALGGKCAVCGILASQTKLFLQNLDLQNPLDTTRLIHGSIEAWPALKSRIGLACYDHRRIARKRSGNIRHGAYWAAFKKKCPCADCLQFKKEWGQLMNEKRRAQRAAAGKISRRRSQEPRKPKQPQKPKIPPVAADVMGLIASTKVSDTTPLQTRAPHGSFHVAVNLGCKCEKCKDFLRS